MENNSAFTAGVAFGGLNDRTEIKILICYLLNAAQHSLTDKQLTDTLVGQELVNYFELQDALSHLVSQQFIAFENEGYSITPEGIEISKQLENALPFSVREKAYKSVLELLQYEHLKRQNTTEILPLKNGGYTVKCTIQDNDFVLFSYEIHMPDEKSAKLAEKKFIQHGHEIFRCVLGITTENPKMYQDFLSQEN